MMSPENRFTIFGIMLWRLRGGVSRIPGLIL